MPKQHRKEKLCAFERSMQIVRLLRDRVDKPPTKKMNENVWADLEGKMAKLLRLLQREVYDRERIGNEECLQYFERRRSEFINKWDDLDTLLYYLEADMHYYSDRWGAERVYVVMREWERIQELRR